MTDDIIRKATTADYIETIDNLRAEVERLRSALTHELDLRNRHIESLEARIKELEAEITAWVADRDSWIARYEAVRKEKDARIADQEAYIERLEAAFLDSLAARLYYEHNYSFTKSDALDLARQQLKAEMLECDLDE